MPIYEYVCDGCGHRFEVMQRITAEPIRTCEKCGEGVRRVIFPSTIIYKGSGFYATEYGRSRHNNPTSSSSSATSATSSSTTSASSASSADSGAESKPSASSSDAATDKGKSDKAGGTASS